MGEGPMGPPMTVKTLCKVQSTPTAVMATVTDLNQLNVTWQVVDNDITCSTGITGYTIYYKVDGSSDNPQRATAVSGSTMYTIIEGLEPGENYIFMVSLTTDQESPLSEASMAVTVPDDDNSIAVFIVIPAVFAIALLIIIITFVLIYRKRSRKASPSPSDPTSFTNNVAIGMEDQDLPTEVKDKTEYKPLERNEMLKSPDQYYNLNQPVSGDQAEGYEVPQDKISSLVESGSTYEAVGSTVVSEASTERELKQDNDYEDPDDIKQYAGVYINVDTAKKTTPPKLIKVSELQDYMSRGRRNVIKDVVKEFMVLPRGWQHPCSEAIQHESLKSKNSLSKTIPYDHTRVKLQVSGNTGESDYYNASIIKAQQGKARFIAAIGPQSKGLAEQFWRMIWQQDVRTLVTLDEDVYSYWPSKVKTSEVFGEMTVLLQQATNHQTYTNRKLKIITADDKILNVHQLQFHIWPQGGVPGDCANLIDFIKQVKTRQEQTKLSPMLIHCRDGSGSTGTFLALYQLLDVLRYSSTISVYNVIRNMREHRMDMVLTRVQYLYIYDTLQHAQLTPEKTKTFSREFNGMDDQTMNRKAVHEFAALRKIQKLNMPQQQQMGEAEENVYKNRFPGIIPFDSSRPVLKSNSVTHGSNDYVNATKLEDDGSIILTQDPMAATLEDFWRLVYDYKCSTIIMLKDMSTANKTAAKYWPDSGMITYGYITVKCVNTESQDLFRTQKFQVMHQDHQEPVIVNHLTFEAFLGDEEDLPRMLDFIQSTGNVTSGPTVIHCLNGVGVSAVYVTVKAQIQRLEKEGACDVYLAVQQLRRKNVNYMLSQDNYILCLKLLRCYLNNQDDYSVIY
ncbi:receptor-type tyrosine-protein phosphatase epsilon-like isoform X2 [Apostichopus japonicus]|uniref:receptor-type tyrosine-protein phosphatase epsilon-like isoform X2 n=1 Tax=Stichopus japonicus TaxID=307972 RepID=UPI003AB560F4